MGQPAYIKNAHRLPGLLSRNLWKIIRGRRSDISSLDIVDSLKGRMLANTSAMARVWMLRRSWSGLVELGLNLNGVHTALDIEKGMEMLRRQIGITEDEDTGAES